MVLTVSLFMSILCQWIYIFSRAFVKAQAMLITRIINRKMGKKSNNIQVETSETN